MSYIVFSCHIILVSKIMLNNRNESRHICLGPNFKVDDFISTWIIDFYWVLLNRSIFAVSIILSFSWGIWYLYLDTFFPMSEKKHLHVHPPPRLLLRSLYELILRFFSKFDIWPSSGPVPGLLISSTVYFQEASSSLPVVSTDAHMAHADC